MIKAIAVDDEHLALEIVEAYCNNIFSVTLLKTFTQQGKALKFINKNKVDLVFLDIEMPNANGLDFCKKIKKDTKVIFTTAYSDYAVEGFNLNASDYLLKPFSEDRFKEAVQKVNAVLALEKNDIGVNTSLTIKADYKLYNVAYDNILVIEAFDDYIKINLQDGSKIVARYTMKSILKELPEKHFVRVHRSYIVAVKKVSSINKDTMVLEGFSIPLGKTYKQDVLKHF